ncbi:hypothetical protein ACT4R0_05675 [Ornithobacterium rhinotracheale]|uniref:hypothetical protein n=1 Tax=Ornithobacterium rhinotracheale TaxID=28251 RepID=UPI004036DD57
MNFLKYLGIIIAFFAFVQCNETAEDLPAEDYRALFGNKKMPPPYIGYETMPKLPCEPQISEEEYIYPGKEIAEKRTYKVTLTFYYLEKEYYGDEVSSNPNSYIMVRYIDEHKKLKILRTYEDEDIPATFKNDEKSVIEFQANSGFPLYLGIYGAGYNSFQMKATLQATSTDGLIVTPEIKYENKFRTDGYSNDFGFCEKIILP